MQHAAQCRARVPLCMAALMAVVAAAPPALAQTSINLSQLEGAAVDGAFVLVDDTPGAISSRFYETTTQTRYLGKDQTRPQPRWPLTFTAGSHTVEVRTETADRKQLRKRAAFTVNSSSTPVSSCVAPAPVVTGARTIAVSNAEQLGQALADAHAGDSIHLASGDYAGTGTKLGQYTGVFALNRSGTPDAPITITASAGARIVGRGIDDSRYGLYLLGAKHVVLRGFAVTQASKGIMLDGSSHVLIDDVKVSQIGAEGVHFRAMSSYNTIRNSRISDVGLTRPDFGEGIYVGSSVTNWNKVSCALPDSSDHNLIEGNEIVNARAESIDVKEGTRGTVIRDNIFIGDASISPSGANDADSWVDIKGNDAVIENNEGFNTLNNGFEVHTINTTAWYAEHPDIPAVLWGSNNQFHANTANVNYAAAAASGNPNFDPAKGWGYWIHKRDQGNVVSCANQVTGSNPALAGGGLANIACTPRN